MFRSVALFGHEIDLVPSPDWDGVHMETDPERISSATWTLHAQTSCAPVEGYRICKVVRSSLRVTVGISARLLKTINSGNKVQPEHDKRYEYKTTFYKFYAAKVVAKIVNSYINHIRWGTTTREDHIPEWP